MRSFLALTISLLASSLVNVTSFTPLTARPLSWLSTPSSSSSSSSTTTTTYAAKKGFGSTPEPPKKKKAVSAATAPSKPDTETKQEKENDESSSNAVVANVLQDEATTTSPNTGQRALAEMRRQRAEQKDAELRKVRAMLDADEQLQSTPAAIPERVAQRMGQRMIPFVGLPLFGGMSCFVLFWYLATYQNMEFQPALVAFSTIAILALSLLGITYSVMSASWDEDRQGDFWGWEEFQRNVQNIREGLDRSKENAVLRDRLESGDLSLEELKKATTQQQRREKPKSLSEKLQQDGLD